ncbi:hypothetical protein DYD21_07685 [Rhodohalobacter sp. SW132]|nr:hypothetical protein DYD21_07685 [Rhodohalobacter sp. SW132]
MEVTNDKLQTNLKLNDAPCSSLFGLINLAVQNKIQDSDPTVHCIADRKRRDQIFQAWHGVVSLIST